MAKITTYQSWNAALTRVESFINILQKYFIMFNYNAVKESIILS